MGCRRAFLAFVLLFLFAPMPGRASSLPVAIGWSELAPMPRAGHAGVFDPAGDCYYLVGNTFHDLIRATPDAPASFESLYPAFTLPADLQSASPDPYSAVLDASRHRILVVVNVYYRADPYYGYLELWAISLDGAPQWERVSNQWGASSVSGYSLVLDPTRDRVVLYGGYYSSRFGGQWSTNTLIAFNLATDDGWSTLPTSTLAPVPLDRFGHGAAYDPACDCMRVFHGARIRGYNPAPLTEVWTLSFGDSVGDSARWEPAAVTSAPPAARYRVRSMWDGARGTSLMFGGTNYTGYTPEENFDDLWELSFTGNDQASWRLVHSGVPGTRSAPAAVFDESRRRVVIHGGRVGSSTGYGIGDGWFYPVDSTTSWKVWTLPMAAPAARVTATAFWHVADQKAYVVFWQGLGGTYVEVFAYDPEQPSWTNLNNLNPPYSLDHMSADHDRRRNRIVGLVTDFGSPSPRVTTMSLVPNYAWATVPTTGDLPKVQHGFDVLCDIGRDRMIVFAGTPPAADSVWTLSFSNNQWSRPTIVGPRPPGSAYRPLLDETRSRMVTFMPSATGLQVWALSLGTPMSWANITPAGGGPSLAYSAAIDRVGDRCIVFDHEGPNQEKVVAWEFALAESSSWNRLEPAGAEWVRRPSALVFRDPTRMLAFVEEVYSDGLSVWSLGFDNATPTQLSLHDVEVVPGRVRIRWQSSDPIEQVRVERRRDQGAWVHLGRPNLDAWGVLTFVDQSVPPGEYVYRLVGATNGEAFQGGEVAVSVPAAPNTLRVEAAAPHPARKRIRLTLTFPVAGPATVEVCDLTGRRILSRTMTPSGPGSELFDLGVVQEVRPGVYFVRVEQSGNVATGRVVVIE